MASMLLEPAVFEPPVFEPAVLDSNGLATVIGDAVADGRIASNPLYTLIRVAEMSDGERAALVELGADVTNGVIDAVLVATTGCGLPDKVVDCAGSTLFRSFSNGGVRTVTNTESNTESVSVEQLFRLLYDEVITIDLGDGPVTGPASFEQLEARPHQARPHQATPHQATPHQSVRATRPSGALPTLSYRALDTVARLQLTSYEQICGRLYWFNRIPLSARWERTLPNESAIRRMLGSGFGQSNRSAWVQNASVAGAGGWLSFVRRDQRRELPSREFPYKLYLSPRPEQLVHVLPAAVAAATDSTTSRFKLGADAAGLLRPDKIVFYLADATEVTNLAQRLAAALVGTAAQGVPFSAELTQDGLLSWGGDPTADESPVGGGRESWRLSVCRRLAESILAAQHCGLSPAAAVAFACRRLELDGVDITSFAPANLIAPTPISTKCAAPIDPTPLDHKDHL